MLHPFLFFRRVFLPAENSYLIGIPELLFTFNYKVRRNTMVIDRFADESVLNRLRNQKTQGDETGIVWPTMVVHTQERHFRKFIPETSLSVFTNYSGKTLVSTGKREYTLCPSSYLIINPFQQISYTIGHEAAMVTNIHFDYSYIHQLFSYYTDNDTDFLDRTDITTIPVFFSELHYKNKDLQSVLSRLLTNRTSECFLEEAANVFVYLLTEHREYQKRIKRLSARKTVTKEEIYTRLSKAKDILYSCYDTPITVSVLSKEVFLSEFHFIRLFKLVYGQSPYQMLKQIRMTKARELLASEHYSVSEIASLVGYEESNSFINAFRTLYGSSPGQYQRKK